ncbi:1350_t:CDS:2 [Entrophospora sp. SA101]|nr:1350_t:CDS:2 [Entrophospora sp. SA101]
MKTAIKEQAKPKRLTDKQMRELLLSLKKEADKMPEEEDSFGVEVICSAGLRSDIPNFTELFSFRKLINTIAHELAHCLMANYKLKFGQKHDQRHQELTQDVEAFL